MNNPMPFQTYEEKMQAALRMPAPDPSFVASLRTQFGTQNLKSPSRLAQLRGYLRRPAWTVAFVILIFFLAILLIIGPEKVLAAVERLFGYVPGVGFVENDKTLRVLPKPVSQTQDGITLTIEQVVADPQRTVLVYRIDDLTSTAARSSKEYGNGLGGIMPVLRLADGTEIQAVHGSLGYGQGKMEYQPLPGNIFQITFEFQYSPTTRPGSSAELWKIPLVLAPADTNSIVQTANDPQLSSNEIEEVTLRLDRVLYESDETILQIGLQWKDPDQHMFGWGTLKLTNSAGQLLPLWEKKDFPMQDYRTHPSQVRILATRRLDASQTYTLSMEDGIILLPMNASFAFDPGQLPPLGQTLAFKTQINDRGYSLQVIAARIVEYREKGQIGLQFDVQRSEGVNGVNLHVDDAHLKSFQNRSGRQLLQPTLFFDQLPTEPFSVKVRSLLITPNEKWELKWQPNPPPDLPVKPTPTDFPTPMPTMTIEPGNDALVERLQKLFQTGYDPFTSQPGWLHVVDENYSDDSGGTLPDGTAMPANSKTDTWFNIDKTSSVTQSVIWMKNLDGSIFQYGVYKHGVSSSNTFSSGDIQVPTELQFGKDIWRSFRNASSSPLSMKSEETQCEGIPCIQIRFPEEYPQPIRLNDDKVATLRAEGEYWINLVTGRILRTQTTYFREDGSQKVSGFREVVFEHVETPPKEVQDALDKVGTK